MIEPKQIMLSELCQEHQRILVQKCGIGPEGPWRSLMVVAQITLFQAATADAKIQDEVKGDVTKIAKLGCLACRKQPQFWDIIDTYKLNGISGLKALGEKWIEDSRTK